METLTLILKRRFKTISMLILSSSLSLVLLMIRIKLHQSFFLLFLIWNLFLALIPYAITTYLISKPKLNAFIFIAIFGVWLLFLPNAPYITTDLLHLMHSDRYLMWLDILVILSFATNGLLLFYLSLFDMEILLKRYLKIKFLKPLLVTVFGLTAFGIYLGRFLRYNSWEIINRPSKILSDIIDLMIINPMMEAWLFTLTFGCFLAITYWLLKTFSKVNS